MRLKDLLSSESQPVNPLALARRDLQRSRPKRFYQAAAVGEQDGGYALLLDGRPARTPAKNLLVVPSLPLAELIATEWQSQHDDIDPSTMPVTRIIHSALDCVAGATAAVQAEIVRYAGSDLLCYRAREPRSLVQAQTKLWDPVISWARSELGARFVLAEGIVFVAQPDHALQTIGQTVATYHGAIGLAALSTLTTLTRSALLSLAVAKGRLTASEAWTAAHVDEDFQFRVWGADVEALDVRARKRPAMDAAARVIALAG